MVIHEICQENFCWDFSSLGETLILIFGPVLARRSRCGTRQLLVMRIEKKQDRVPTPATDILIIVS